MQGTRLHDGLSLENHKADFTPLKAMRAKHIKSAPRSGRNMKSDNQLQPIKCKMRVSLVDLKLGSSQSTPDAKSKMSTHCDSLSTIESARRQTSESTNYSLFSTLSNQNKHLLHDWISQKAALSTFAARNAPFVPKHEIWAMKKSNYDSRGSKSEEKLCDLLKVESNWTST